MANAVIQELDNYNIPERYQLGKITNSAELNPGNLGLRGGLVPASVKEVTVSDPYLEMLDTEIVETVQLHEKLVDRFVRERRHRGLWQRQVGTAYTDANGVVQEKNSWGDPVAKELFFKDLGSTALTAWLSLIPSSMALMYLADPVNSEAILDKKGKQVGVMDDTARLWLTACTDAVGIRSRGSVMAEAVKDFVQTTSVDERDVLKWMSVACGTALPAMKAANSANLRPDLVLVDIDKDAMRSTKELASTIGFQGHIEQQRINIFNSSEMAKLREHLGENGARPRIIDLMGIFEYTGENLGVDSAEFLRSNYDMLHPGGRLIFGQMRTDRPNPDFTMGAVSWPWIEMRSPADFMRIVNAAGIASDNVSLILPKDGVYTVGVIDKPQTDESFAVHA